ncbi:MAG: 30S ribosomal protein S7 [Patescibacteria group bacterium]
MRSKTAPKRKFAEDKKYKSVKVSRLIGRVMKDGKKSVAQAQVYFALEKLAEITGKKPLEAFEVVLRNIMPQMEVRSRRVGGAAYQIPVPVRGGRGFSLVTRWLVLEANKRSNKENHSFGEKLAAEMIDAYNNQGRAIERKNASHKMADANKAFAHFRW